MRPPCLVTVQPLLTCRGKLWNKYIQINMCIWIKFYTPWIFKVLMWFTTSSFILIKQKNRNVFLNLFGCVLALVSESISYYCSLCKWFHQLFFLNKFLVHILHFEPAFVFKKLMITNKILLIFFLSSFPMGLHTLLELNSFNRIFKHWKFGQMLPYVDNTLHLINYWMTLVLLPISKVFPSTLLNKNPIYRQNNLKNGLHGQNKPYSITGTTPITLTDWEIHGFQPPLGFLIFSQIHTLCMHIAYNFPPILFIFLLIHYLLCTSYFYPFCQFYFILFCSIAGNNPSICPWFKPTSAQLPRQWPCPTKLFHHILNTWKHLLPYPFHPPWSTKIIILHSQIHSSLNTLGKSQLLFNPHSHHQQLKITKAIIEEVNNQPQT
ncbi:hypothetical protein VP01_4062g1 [Puccinia sorghi]|uniref:Uncharacterized protein n=1 Tax=Puccinia sorghi TaxID=27349 RepID=A0A0L6URL5_9BASI|nr:hypothetical protein VP01_4062g1 [Puccinia sorghi]